MTEPDTTNGLEQLWEHGKHKVQQLDEWSHGWLGILVSTVRQTLLPKSAITAAAIAYFALFSLFPFILLSIFIASFNLIPRLDQQFILSRIEFVAPALGQLLGTNINHIIRSRGPITIVALVGLVWSASNVINMLNQTLYDIWDYKKIRPAWKQRGLAIVFVLTFVGPVLILISFASSVIGSIHFTLFDQIKSLVDVTSILVAILLDVALFMLLYTLLPHGKSSWRENLPGAIAAGILWELAKKAFVVFVSVYLSTSNLIYGSVAAVIAFLTWAYLSGLIFLLGAYLNRAYFRSKQQHHNVKAL